MKTPHTPGPWNAHQPGFKGLVSGIVRDKQNRFVATAASPATGEYNRDENEIDANARLIAAAPELLEQLQNFVDAIDIIAEGAESEPRKSIYKSIQTSLTYQRAKEAIQKATE